MEGLNISFPFKKNSNGPTKTVFTDKIIAEAFLPAPRENGVLIHKDENIKNNEAKNLEWVYPLDIYRITDEVSCLLSDDEYDEEWENPIKYTKTKSQLKQDIDCPSDDEDSHEINLRETLQISDDNTVVFEELSDVQKPHAPIFEEFRYDEIEYDLNDAFEKDGKLWKIAKYKHYQLKHFYISEDMELYSIKAKKIVDQNSSEFTINRCGEHIFRFHIFETAKRINLKDILGSTFLKIPKDAILTVHRNWNKNIKDDKYIGQKNHYTNIRWLCVDDFKMIKDTVEKTFISKQGDLYYFRDDIYRMRKDDSKKNGLRKARIREQTFQINIATALAFVDRPDKTYRYVMYKNGDVTNNHYRNLIWVNTLTGKYSNDIYYFEIPGFPGYAISETGIPYSFKRGIFKEIKLQEDVKGYLSIGLSKCNKRVVLRYSRVVAATRNKNFDNSLYIDHIDRIRKNNCHENLRSVTPRENSLNKTKYKKGREIIQLDENLNIIAVYENSAIAVESLGFPHTRKKINGCCNANSKTENGKYMSGNYVWRHLDKREAYVPRDGERFVILSGDFQGIILKYDKYAVSNYGTIIDIKKGFSKKTNTLGYPSVQLSNIDFSKNYHSVHILVALVFVSGRTNEKSYVNHLDEDKSNFSAENLQWVTLSENVKYSAYKRGIPVKKISLDTGEILQVFDSRTDAGISCGKNEYGGSDIGKVCNGDQKHAFGFFWQDIKFEELSNYPGLILNKRKEIYG